MQWGGKTWHIFSRRLHQRPFWSPQLTFHGIIYNESYHKRKVLKPQRTLKRADNHCRFLHSLMCSQACARTLTLPTHSLSGIIALTRPNCPPFICMSMTTHILHDSPFDKEGSFPQQWKWSPLDIVWLDFAFSRFQDHYKNSFEVLLKMKLCDPLPAFNYSNTTFFFALILFFFCLSVSVPFQEIKIIRLVLKWDQGGPIFTQEVILFPLSDFISLLVHQRLNFFFIIPFILFFFLLKSILPLLLSTLCPLRTSSVSFSSPLSLSECSHHFGLVPPALHPPTPPIPSTF